ncbi:uncharacterized protein LOC119376802 [Rhipicephalus sanguineus]|uniref:uncharacterized protein LOC119376802 n=1 Tax=Rhipicephalus sanguineus TaxID=34632 RepID=UPI001895506C|nr:uncharacterized protein LOC119376802 [Rhipicephalus sanguineus]
MAQGSPEKWFVQLPLVLLGIRTAIKSDLGCSCAELVYGSSLRLPCDFIEAPAKTPVPLAGDYVSDLQNIFQQLRPVPTRPHESRAPYVSPQLTSATNVFVRNCAARKPLQPHYSGPYRVLERRPSTFVVNGRADTIALERIKPAYFESTLPSAPPSRDATLLRPGSLPSHATPKTSRVTWSYDRSSDFPPL